MRRLLVIILLLSVGSLTQAQESDIFTDPWRAEYFSNATLEDLPNLTRFDRSIGFNWQLSAPMAGLPVDDFSIHWSKGGNLPAGTYRFIMTASTGFRIYVDDEMILDAWDGEADGQTTGTDIDLEAGFHTIDIEYYAADGEAYVYLDWGLAPDGEVAPQPTTATENAVTVMVNTLNVRSTPRISNNLIARIAIGQSFIELDRSEDGRWVKIDLGNGQTGWVSAAYVTAGDTQDP